MILDLNGVEIPLNAVFLDSRVGSSLALNCFAPVLMLSCDKGLSRVKPYYKLSRVVRKPAFCICENIDVDQLCGNRTADQRLCFRYTDSTIPLLSKSEISSLLSSSMAVQTGLCQTWSETPKTGFLTTRLNYPKP